MLKYKRPSVVVLEDCIQVQNKKAQDYQNPASTVKQADYYLNGVQTIYDTMHGKMLRIRSIQETILNNPDFTPNHESLRDSVIDLINYASFYAAYLDHGIPGQDVNCDIFNRPIKPKVEREETSPEVSYFDESKSKRTPPVDDVYRARRETHP